MTGVTEKHLEDEVTASLLRAGGYQAVKVGNSAEHKADFDAELGLDLKELLGFIQASQPDAWTKLVTAHGGSEQTARERFAKRLAQQLDERGTVDVLRHGVRDQNVEIRLSYRRPAFGVAPELVAHYDANRLTVTRQFPYDPRSAKTVDVALLVNGIPVATAELKNPLTGQSIEHAIHQYRNDRDPRNVALSRRAIVHFAVDPERVAMTTKLEGKATRFLPFNLGRDLGAGNPDNPHGHKTAYLWERVWARDAWLDILHRFIHVDRPEKGSAAQKRAAEKVIFPRLHQWDAVLKLEADARVNGAGRSYLVQHSAGSGKSNTIAWAAHRLSVLHDDQDRKVFDKVVVITDRTVLDRQLQETIYQFEHARGVVVRIDKDSKQLAEALQGEQARIIITTLQKFPFVIGEVKNLPARAYAVIVDEAHSSQGGEAAKDLRIALGDTSEQELTVAEAEDSGLLALAVDPVEDALAQQAGARRRDQSNLSFFAFTATPKGRTLELFGEKNPDTGKHEPFHLYSMKQAIEEGFIMDVLSNYCTYKTFWKIEKQVESDPEYDPKSARRAIARFVELHPYALEQKAEIIIEHFRANTRREMDGQAKAMVVTSSRLAAVRYKQALDKYIRDHGYADEIRTLVALSGSIDDGTGMVLTEQGMNGFPEGETAQRFDSPDYELLIVAEKFQTGFDQPKLQTMYVDKTLVGLAAVQTLSRLNRLHPLKQRTFVLDFRNDTDDIVDAFDEYHGVTIAPPTDPNVLADSRAVIDEFDALRPDEVATVVGLLLNSSLKTEDRSAKVYTALGPARGRFGELESDEERREFRAALVRFVRIYSFVAQIAAISSPELERDYLFCRALALYLRDANTATALDLGSEVELSHLRNQQMFDGSLKLTATESEVDTFYGTGTGAQQQLELETLSTIVGQLNDRFGTDLSDSDRLFIEQVGLDLKADEELAEQARSNDLENFALAFHRKFIPAVLARDDANTEILKLLLDNEEVRRSISEFYLRETYTSAREAA